MLMKTWNELCGSRNTPSYYPFLMFDPSQYVSWDDVDECLYRTDMKWELISPDGIKDEVPTFTSAWYGDYQETRYITHKIKKGYGFVITKYGRYNKRTNDLCREIENTLDVTSDLHIYGGHTGSHSFKPHKDETENIIIQVEGNTPWMVFDDEFNPQLNVTLYPGDAIFIPKGWYHQAKPSNTRLSMSIAMFDKSRITIDRDHLTLNPN